MLKLNLLFYYLRYVVYKVVCKVMKPLNTTETEPELADLRCLALGKTMSMSESLWKTVKGLCWISDDHERIAASNSVQCLTLQHVEVNGHRATKKHLLTQM